MRKIYLVRHGKPYFTGEGRWCIGRTDTPVGTLGKLQAVMLGKEAEAWNLSAVYSSPLRRARQTAEPVLAALRTPDARLRVKEDLIELDAGIWDGHSFAEIQQRWPELYEKRVDPEVLIPGQEPYEDAQNRFLTALYAAVDESSGNIAIVAHTTVFCLALCALSGKPWKELRSFNLPYGSYTVLGQDSPGEALRLDPEDIGLLPHPELDEDICMQLLLASDLTTDQIIRHSAAVKDEALRVADALNSAHPGLLDRKLVESGALLHDVARLGESHEKLGAKYIEDLGYPEISDIIRQHKELDSSEINEAAVVCMADKCRKGEIPVTVEQRFEAKLQNFYDPQALASAKRRYALACEVRNRINEICGTELIPVGSFENGSF